jgi:predicted aldo/keto reductase-like oxidoreductase
MIEAIPTWRFLPRRSIGKTGFVASILGIGDLADRSTPADELVAILHRAMLAGLNVIDTAPSYEDGFGEEVVGRALQGRRADTFLIDKIDYLDQPVTPQVDESLRRLGHGQVDLFAFHAVATMDDWQALAKPGGPLDELAECVKQGKTRFRGISAHHPAVVMAAIASGLCDVVMFPVGPYCDTRYIRECLPLARAAGVGTICFKAFGAGKLVSDTQGYGRPLPSPAPGDPFGKTMAHLSVEECLRFTLTCDPDVTLLGLSTAVEQDAAFAGAADFLPYTDYEMDQIRLLATEAVEGKGPVWWDPQP